MGLRGGIPPCTEADPPVNRMTNRCKNITFIVSNGAFTITEPNTDTETKTDKMATIPNGISVSVQYEYLHTILYKLFLCISVSVSVSVSVNAPYNRTRNRS